MPMRFRRVTPCPFPHPLQHSYWRADRVTKHDSKWGWYKLAGLFLKIAAAALLAAKILVGVAVVAVAATIYHVVRAA